MRVDVAHISGTGGTKIRGGGSAAESLKKGDMIRANVVSVNKDGSAVLKMENGLDFGAKFGADVKFMPGDIVLLKVTGNEEGILSLSFEGVETEEEDMSAPQKSLVRDFTDKSLITYAKKLSVLNMPVTEQSAILMREIIAQNPSLSMEEAAFIASNKLGGDVSFMEATLEVLAGKGKLDAIIGKLITELKSENKTGLSARDIGLFDDVTNLQEKNVLSSAAGVKISAQTANPAPLTDFLTVIIKNADSILHAFAQDKAQSSTILQQIITQSDSNMQTNAENVENNYQFGEKGGGLSISKDVASGNILQSSGEIAAKEVAVAESEEKGAGVKSAAPSTIVPDAEKAGAQAASGQIVAGAANKVAQAANPGQIVGGQIADEAASNVVQAANPQAGEAIASVVSSLLSDMPQFSGTPSPALERFSNMLLKIAAEGAIGENNADALAAQLEKLFTRISVDDQRLGARLHEAKQELFARLSLIQEALSNSEAARSGVMETTQRLINHVRVINSIEQFVYMQLPVKLADDERAAELYVFKRKGGKREDKDNVNILLAIDLEFMGHWEALINIKGKDVSVNMEVQDMQIKDHFNENTVLLHTLLDEAGFKLVSTNIDVTQEETTPLTALTTLGRYSGQKQGTIDFVV